MTAWKPNLIPPKGDKITFPKGAFPNRAGKSWFWEKWLKAQPEKIEKLRELEVNFIAFDECAERCHGDEDETYEEGIVLCQGNKQKQMEFLEKIPQIALRESDTK